jgi:dipeptidyl aminopeptidase/acylaminoacyl peptidase
VEGFDLSDDNRTIVLSTNEDGISQIHLIDTATAREIPAPRPPDGQVTGLKFRKGSREFAFTFSSARSPADAYTCNLSDNIVHRWTTSETGGLDTSRFVEPELIHFVGFDGRNIPAFVYRPSKPTNQRRPVLIDIHGGPEGQFRPGYLGRANALIDELGIVLIYPNVRGSTGYGKIYLGLDNGRLREDAVADIGFLLDWIAQQPDLDASRVAVQGGSYGGYMALSSMTHFNDRLRAGIDVVGISNFVTFLKNTQPYRRDLRRAEYGDEREPMMAEFLQKISPLNSADKITRPLLVVQGKNDPRVPATESDQMVAKVRKNGGPVWYVVGKNEGHGFAKKPNQDYQQDVQVTFLRRYLLGKEGD